jgi:hypothetical protein
MPKEFEDSRGVGEDTLSLNLSSNSEALGLLEGKNAGDSVSLKNVRGRLITNENGKVQLQIDEVEFAGGQTQKSPDGEEVVTPPTPDGQDSPILVLLGVPDEEQRTDGASRSDENV